MKYQYQNPQQFNQNQYPQGGWQQPPYGYYVPDPRTEEIRRERKRISLISGLCAAAILAFLGLSFVLSGLLQVTLPNFEQLILNDSLFNEALNMVSTAILIFVPFLIAYLIIKKKNFAGELILGTPYDKKNFLLLIPIAIMICIIGSIATSYFSEFFLWLFGVEFEMPDDVSDYGSVSGVLISLLSTAVLPAFVEEFAIRGVVMQSLRRYGDWFAIIMSSLVFALMHGNMVQIPFAFIAGIGIGYAVIKTGTMWTGIIIHFINNSIAVFSMVAYNGLSETGFSVFSGILYAVVFLIGIICLIAFSGRNPRMLELSKGECRCLSTGNKTSRFIINPVMIIAIIVLCIETSMFISKS